MRHIGSCCQGSQLDKAAGGSLDRVEDKGIRLTGAPLAEVVVVVVVIVVLRVILWWMLRFSDPLLRRK